MHFSQQQIELALQMKRAGLHWQPQTGQYAFDLKGAIKSGSPFQPRVYYLLDFGCFVDYFGSQERLVESMAWLPTFEEIVQVARELSIEPAGIGQSFSRGILNDSEIQSLYRLVLTEIELAS